MNDARSPVTILSDPMENDFGPARVAVLLAEALSTGHEVTVAALRISPELVRRLQSSGVRTLDLGVPASTGDSSIAYLLDWWRAPKWSRRLRARGLPPGDVVNLSNTLVAPALAWYAQGAVSDAVRSVLPSLGWATRLGATLALPWVSRRDRSQLRVFESSTKLVVLNSASGIRAYRDRGIRVDGVLPSPLDTRVYCPPPGTPSEGYALGYLGKETDVAAYRAIAEAGVPLRLFGGKAGRPPQALQGLPGVELLGRVDEARLVELYGQARLTVFPFTVEPFGYIPLESMACGTPVLTYGREGPGETVLSGRTGWLVNSRAELVQAAKSRWGAGPVPREMRSACVERAAAYDYRRVGEMWERLLATPVPRGPWSQPGVPPG